MLNLSNLNNIPQPQHQEVQAQEINNNNNAPRTGLTISCVYNLLHNDSIVRWSGEQVQVTSPNILTNVNKACFRSFTGDLLPFTNMSLPTLHCDVILNDNISSSNVSGYLKSTENVYQATSFNYSNQQLNKILELTKAWTYDKDASSQLEHNIKECISYINSRFNFSMYPDKSGVCEYKAINSYTTLKQLGRSITDLEMYSYKYNPYSSVPIFYRDNNGSTTYRTLTIDSTTKSPVFDDASIVSSSGDLYINYEKDCAVLASGASTYLYYKSSTGWFVHESLKGECLATQFILNRSDDQFSGCCIQLNGERFMRLYQKYININSLYRINLEAEGYTVAHKLLLSWYDNSDSKIRLLVFRYPRATPNIGKLALFEINFSTTAPEAIQEASLVALSSYDSEDIDYNNFYDTIEEELMHHGGHFRFESKIVMTPGVTTHFIQGFGLIDQQTIDGRGFVKIRQYMPAVRIASTTYICPFLSSSSSSSYIKTQPLKSNYISGFDIKNSTVQVNDNPPISNNQTPINFSRINDELAVVAFINGVDRQYTLDSFNEDDRVNAYNVVYEPGRTIDAKLTDEVNKKSYSLMTVDGLVTCNDEDLFEYASVDSIKVPYVQFVNDSSTTDKAVMSMSLHIYTDPFYFDLYTPISYVQTDSYTILTNPSSTIINMLNQDIFQTLEYLILLKYEYNDLQLRVNNFPNSDNIVFTNNETCNVMFKEMKVNGNSCTLIINVCDSDGNAIGRETLKQLYGKLALCIDWVQE